MEMIQLYDAVVKGSSNISLNKVKDDEGVYPLYSAKGFYKNISFFHQEEEYLAIIKDGAGIGRISIHPPKSSCVGTMQYLIPKEGFNIRFIRYCLLSIDFTKYSQGATIPHIYFKDYKSELIPKLSVEEQLELVSKLDQAFEAIDQAIANTKKNIENVDELFQSQLANEINQFDNNELVSWNTHVEIRSGRGQKEVEDDNGKYPIVGSAGKTMGYANDYISEENSIIIGRKGTINKPIFMHSKYWNVDTGFGLHALNGLQSEYLFLFCLNYDFTKHDKGSGRPSLVKRDLMKIEMNLPSESEQTQCIERVKTFKEYNDSLKRSLSLKTRNLEDLKMSILEKAFKGELV